MGYRQFQPPRWNYSDGDPSNDSDHDNGTFQDFGIFRRKCLRNSYDINQIDLGSSGIQFLVVVLST